MDFKYFIGFIFPLSVFLLLVLYLTIIPSAPAQTIKEGVTVSDTFQHIFAYSFLSILFFRFFNTTSFKNKAIHLALLSAFLYGFVTESFQLFIESRVFSFKDITANLLGSCFVLIRGVFKK